MKNATEASTLFHNLFSTNEVSYQPNYPNKSYKYEKRNLPNRYRTGTIWSVP